MSLDSLYICSRCKSRFPIGNIRYNNRGALVCINCLEGKTGQRSTIEKPDIGILSFICIDCRYKFKIKKGSPQRPVCPYCGRSRIMQIKKLKDENDLIRDASDSKFDY